MVEAIRALRREHGNAAKLLDVLERQLETFHTGGTPDYDIVRAAVDYFTSYPQICHHPKEDIVYAKLKAVDPAAAEALGDLAVEHARLAGLTRRFADAVTALLGAAEMPRGAFERAVGEFIDQQRHHMAMEEERFFPKALESLSEEDWVEVDRQIVDRDDPLFGADVEARFRALRENILQGEREAL